MNHHLLLILISIPLLAGMLFYSCNSPKKRLEKLSEEQVIKLYEKKKNIKISDKRDYCFVEIDELKGVFAIGSFASDRGCMGDEIAVGRKIGKMKDLMKEALFLNGWKNKSKQADLALKWVENVLLVWESPLKSKNDNFEKEGVEFQDPSVEKVDGNWQVKIWVQEPSGMLPEANYYRLQVDISPNAEILEQKSLSSFSHAYR